MSAPSSTPPLSCAHPTLNTEEARRAETAHAAEELQRALAAEDDLRMVTYKAFVALLGPVALAQVLVAAFPYWPDMGAAVARLMARVAARHGGGGGGEGGKGAVAAGAAAAAAARQGSGESGAAGAQR